MGIKGVAIRLLSGDKRSKNFISSQINNKPKKSFLGLFTITFNNPRYVYVFSFFSSFINGVLHNELEHARAHLAIP